MLSRSDARNFYDRFGAKQDRQGFYEDAALTLMIELGKFADAGNVLELGCGTGRLADKLLSACLPPAAKYVGLDISSTMVELAGSRLSRYHGRAVLRLSDGGFDFSRLGGPFDRVVSTYVLDLLSPTDIEECLNNAHASISEGGLFCHAGLTNGTGPISKLTSGVWTMLHRLRPMLVGGCRPLVLADHIAEDQWALIHRKVVVSAGIPSEVVILRAR